MSKLNRLKNRGIARLANALPPFKDYLTASYIPPQSQDIPWTPIKKSLSVARIALITTGGLHHLTQKPFSMDEPNGDPTYRIIEPVKIENDYTITHDYYDHRDAEKDINIILPVTRLSEMVADNKVGSAASQHFSFMGHIKNSSIDILLKRYIPEVIDLLLQDQVDAVLLTPG